MKRDFFAVATTMIAMAAALASCANDASDSTFAPADSGAGTRAYGDKTPKVMVYYEINDVNPLNAISYDLASGGKFIDIVNLFAANIHKDSQGNPTIYFNDKLAPVMADVDTYIRPIQDAGMKVLLTVLGDWKGIGVANLNPSQAAGFAKLLCYIVDQYGLDGVGFDDEYSDYSGALVAGSYGNVIKALRAEFNDKFPGQGKLIHVFQWGNYGSSQIDAAAGAMIDYADHGSFSPFAFSTSSLIAGMTGNRWMPMAINMGQSYSLYLSTIRNNAASTKNQGYGGIMMFNVRPAGEVNPLPVFNAIAQGAFNTTATFNGTQYYRDWTPDPNGHTISNGDVPSGY